MRTWTCLVLASSLCMGACASTFVASKDGKGYYLGNSSGSAFKLFCESGDLNTILSSTKLPAPLKDSLYSANCGTARSKEGVRSVYTSMTPEQRKDLRQAFQKNGYDINAMRC